MSKVLNLFKRVGNDYLINRTYAVLLTLFILLSGHGAHLQAQIDCNIDQATLYFNGDEVTSLESTVWSYPCRSIDICIHLDINCSSNETFYLIASIAKTDYLIPADDGDFDMSTTALEYKYVKEINIDEGYRIDEYYCFSLDIDFDIYDGVGKIAKIFGVGLYDNPIGSAAGVPAIQLISAPNVEVVNPIDFLSTSIGTSSSSVNSVSNLISSGIVNSVNTDNLTIKGTLIVDTDWTLDVPTSGIPTVISMHPGSQLVIEDNVDFIMNGIYMHGCHQLWESIKVEPQANVTIISSVITNAEIAIEPIIDPLNGESGLVNLSNVRIESNKIGIDVPNTVSSQSVNIFFTGNGNNKFHCNALILPAYGSSSMLRQGISTHGINLKETVGMYLGSQLHFRRQTTGIRADFNSNVFVDQNSFHIGNSGIVGTGGSKLSIEGNYFNNLSIGVQRLFGASHSVIGNTFEGIDRGVMSFNNNGYESEVVNNSFIRSKVGVLYALERPALSTAIMDNEMVDVGGTRYQNTTEDGVGVRVTTYGYLGTPNPVLLVSNNSIKVKEALSGIHLNNSSNAFIVDNFISKTQIDNDISADFSGMRLTAGELLDLRENEVDMLSNSGRTSAYLLNATLNYILNCNKADNTWDGYRYFGQSNGVFRTNESNSHDIGLNVLIDAVMGQQNFRGNVWMSPSSGPFQALNDNTSSFLISASKFFVNGPVGTIYHPINNHPPNVWFEDNPLSDNEECEFTGGELPLIYSPIDTLLTTGEQDIFQSGTSMYFEALRNLLKKLPGDWQNEEPWSSLPELEMYEDVESFNTLDLMWQALTQFDGDPLIGHNEELRVNFNSMKTMNGELNEGLISLEVFIGELTNLRSSVKGIHWDRMSLYEGWDNIVNAELSNIRDYLLTLPVAYEFQYNEVYTQLSLIDFIVEKKEELSEGEYNALESIASQCPLTGGKGVYLARDLINRYDYNDEELCEMVTPRSLRENASQDLDELEVRPNPATTEVQIAIPSSGTLYLYDISGKLMMSQVFSEQSDTILDLSQLSPGLYTAIFTSKIGNYQTKILKQ